MRLSFQIGVDWRMFVAPIYKLAEIIPKKQQNALHNNIKF